MREKKLLMSAFLSCVVPCLCLAEEAQDKMVLSFSDGTEARMELSGIQRLDFLDASVSIVAAEGSSLLSSDVPYGDVKRITFDLSLGAGVKGTLADAAGVSVFPNPVTDFVNVRGDFAEPVSVSVWSASGQLCKVVDKWDGSPIDVSSLSKGVYVLKVNGKSFKFVKL